jgi:F-type H+-transporting ATPase subunit gamma
MISTVAGTESVSRLLQSISGQDESAGSAGAEAQRLKVLRVLQPNDGPAGTITLVITANRGLCGSYNASVLRQAQEHRNALIAQGKQPEIEMVGKKGVGYFRFMRLDMARKITDVEDRIAFARVAEMADRYIDLYIRGEVSRVDVVYMRFHSVGVQRPAVAQLLPIEPPRAAQVAGAQSGSGTPGTAAPAGPTADFEFSPPPEDLLARLIPETVRIRLFQYFNDAIVSEQVSRMIAMKAATDAAGDMIKALSRKYNRARQTLITLELADIVGGANALQ